jgi:branched-chain amino acid transport system ATP-binding protein
MGLRSKTPAAAAPSDGAEVTGLVLETRNLQAGYGGTTVLRDVNIAVAKSAVVALLGPNGAGKTTLLRAITGVIRPTGGRVLLNGRAIETASADRIARAGLCHIPEGRGVFPSLTVEENLVLQSVKGEESGAKERAASAFPELAKRMRQVAGSLSGGEQQMLAMARMYLAKADIVVVDEASLGLAPVVVDRIFDALAKIVESGKALLLVEQYVARALALADTAYILDRGAVVHSGPAKQLRADEIAERYMGVEK